MKQSCIICNRGQLIEHNGYMRCLYCGHELIVKEVRGVYIVNEELNALKVKHRDALDRFRSSIISKTALKYDYLVDIGSASGKFIYQSGNAFKKCIGVEVTKVCIDFSRNILGIDVVEAIGAIPQNPISVVSFWHSLEHIDLEVIKDIFSSVRPLVNKETRVIISVPNSNSLLYRLFGRHYSYFDDASHMHQFSPRSLDILMEQFGYQKTASFPSLTYASFGAVQTILNTVNKRHDFLYYYLKRGSAFGLSKKSLYLWAIYNVLLLPLVAFPSLLLASVDFVSPRRGSVLTVCYKINQQ